MNFFQILINNRPPPLSILDPRVRLLESMKHLSLPQALHKQWDVLTDIDIDIIYSFLKLDISNLRTSISKSNEVKSSKKDILCRMNAEVF